MLRQDTVHGLIFASCFSLIISSCCSPAVADPTDQRHSDGLLERKDLQQIVELQCDRDAVGIANFFVDKDPLVRARAAFAMASVQNSSAVPGLLLLLDDSDARVRVDAAFALRQNQGVVSSKVLLDHLVNEKNVAVRAMLFAAIGFKGDADTYETVFKLALPGMEIPQALCAIYYLQQRGVVTQAGIDRMLELLGDDQPDVREHAAYFFYTMKRKNVTHSGLATELSELVRSYPYHEPAAPFLLAYIASAQRQGDADLILDWSQNGTSVRARSFAFAGMRPFTDDLRIRSALIHATTDLHDHIAMAAGEVISSCDDLTRSDLQTIKRQLLEDRAKLNARPYLLKALWRANNSAFVYDVIDRIPDDKELQRIAAFSACPQLEFLRIKDDLARLSASNDPQVLTMTGVFLAERMAHSTSTELFAAMEELLGQMTNARLRSEVLYMMAHALRGQPKNEFVAIFHEYYRKFLKASDIQSAATCLIILGHSQAPGVSDVLRQAAKHSEPIVKMAAQGASSLSQESELQEVYKYEMAFSPRVEIDWEFLASYGRHPRLVLTTDKGNIVIQMDAEQAPMGVQHIIQFVEKGRYDAMCVYRVEPNHVTQMGTMGHYSAKVLSEYTRIAKQAYSVGIGDFGKDTGSQHIAITHLIRPHNEGKYTTIGDVVDGRAVVLDTNKYDLVLRSEIIRDQKHTK